MFTISLPSNAQNNTQHEKTKETKNIASKEMIAVTISSIQMLDEATDTLLKRAYNKIQRDSTDIQKHLIPRLKTVKKGLKECKEKIENAVFIEQDSILKYNESLIRYQEIIDNIYENTLLKPTIFHY